MGNINTYGWVLSTLDDLCWVVLEAKMGINGGLVRSVFLRGQSAKAHDSNVKNNVLERRRWSFMKAYLCGDEFNSVNAEVDSASVHSSEATVTQLLKEESPGSGDIQSNDTTDDHLEKEQNPELRRLREEAAAVIIQSAFRGFKVRNHNKGTEEMSMNVEFLAVKESPSRESLGTSIEVQGGHSIEVVSIQEDVTAAYNRTQHKTKPSTFRPKEDWDDSTVDSSISQMRIQNRLEAMTRRERALAYAFSQQLRICSKTNKTKAIGTESHIGLNWLERWMATRLPESSSVEDHVSKQLETVTIKSRPGVGKKLLELSFEGKESCGSNEVPVPIDSLENTTSKDKVGYKSSAKNRIKATKSVSRRKTVPTYHRPRELGKASKKGSSREAEKDKRQKAKQ
ncbi:hypothetical protein Ancab_008097 [Ancistrocladus abbreviatus]